LFQFRFFASFFFLVLFFACFFLIFSFSLLNRRVFLLVVEFRNQDRSKVFFSLFFPFFFFFSLFPFGFSKLFKSFRQNSRIVVQTLCVSQTEIGACFGNGEINFSMK